MPFDNKHRLRQLSYVMVHDSNFVLTESIITALKEKFVTIFAGKPLLFEVLFFKMFLLFEKGSSTSSK